MIGNGITHLYLLQLADSALPIGATAHSFGLESLVESGALTVDGLYLFLTDYLGEISTLEAAYCRAAYVLSTLESASFQARWLELNRRLDALKLARESRTASTTLGRRLIQLAAGLEARAIFEWAQSGAKENGVGLHHCTAFGLVCGTFGIDQEMAVLAYLQQSMTGLISACQRLLPLGQSQASRISWALKPAMIEATQHSRDTDLFTLPVFALSVESASMSHPGLTTRLFIS